MKKKWPLILAIVVSLVIGFLLGQSLNPFRLALFRVNLLLASKKTDDRQKAASILDAEKAFRSEAVNTVNLDESRKTIALSLAEEYSRKEMWPEALRQAELAGGLQPGNYRALYLEALCAYRMANLTNDTAAVTNLRGRATEAVEKAEKINPEGGDLHYLAGRMAWERKDYREALDRFRKVLAKYPDDTDTLFALARVYYDTAEWKKAQELYLKLENLLPRNSTRLDTVEKNLSVLQDLVQNSGAK